MAVDQDIPDERPDCCPGISNVELFGEKDGPYAEPDLSLASPTDIRRWVYPDVHSSDAEIL